MRGCGGNNRTTATNIDSNRMVARSMIKIVKMVQALCIIYCLVNELKIRQYLAAIKIGLGQLTEVDYNHQKGFETK